jgi:Holliday junction DNA helicase RuvB
VNRFVKTLRDYQIVGYDINKPEETEKIFASLGIDTLGLDELDRKLLHTLAYHFSGHAVGLHTLASIV